MGNPLVFHFVDDINSKWRTFSAELDNFIQQILLKKSILDISWSTYFSLSHSLFFKVRTPM